MFKRLMIAMSISGGLNCCADADGQESKIIPPPPTIAAEEVPEVPAELYESLRRYQNVRSATFADWAPFWDRGVNRDQKDTGSMLVITRFADTAQVHRVAFPGADRYQLTFHPERVLSAQTRPKHDAFLYVADSGGAENYQFYLQGLTAGTPVRISDGKSRHIGPEWSPSGKLLAYSSNARNGRDMDIYVIDPDVPGSARLVKEVTGTWTVNDWSPDETKLVAVESISINESYVHIIDVATGATETLTPRRVGNAPQVAYSDVKWSPDGKALYWITDKDSEFRRLAKFDLTTKDSVVFSKEIPWNVEGFDVSDDGQELVFIANEEGFSDLYRLDAQTGKHFDPFAGKTLEQRNSQPKTPERVVRNTKSGVKYRPGSIEYAYTASSFRSPSDVSGRRPGSAPETWTVSERAGFDTDAFSDPELIAYKSFDQREIPAFVYRPNPEKFPGKRPVIIDIHGGPESQTRPSFLGRDNYLIDELGITLIFPNVRGSDGYGKSYLLLDNGMKREDSVKDIGALLDWIATQDDLDSERVGVTGGSYGGYMSLAVQATYGDRIKAGVDIVGISNFVTFLENTSDYRRDLRRAEYGDERDPEMRAFLERIAPLNQAHKIKNPILIVQGQNDPRVPLSEAAQMVAAIRKNGRPVWYMVGTNEGHGFAKKVNQDYLQAVEVLFWRRHLLGGTK